MSKTFIDILTGFFSFLAGVLIAWFTAGYFRQLIRFFYQLTTGNAFQFYGKPIVFNLDPLYYIIFGITTLALWACLKMLSLKKGFFWLSISFTIFFLFTLLFALIDGNLRVISCTMCNDGIINLHWNDLNYNSITEFGLLVAITPLVIMTIVNKKISQQRKLI